MLIWKKKMEISDQTNWGAVSAHFLLKMIITTIIIA